MDAELRRETAVFTDSEDELEQINRLRRVSKSADEYPDAFLHAIREGTVASFLTPSISISRSSSVESLSSSDDSCHHSPTKVRKLTMIPESVMAALTNIQQNQLRRLREDASNHLEDILRSVVKTLDVYYSADQITREVLMPAKKSIGSEESEEETRIKDEIKKILKGDIDDKRASMCRGNEQLAVVEKRKKSVGAKDEVVEEEEEVIATVTGEAEEPVCQVMLNIIDDLCDISFDRQTILTEVLEWMERYPPGSLPGLWEDDDDDACVVPEGIEEFDEEKVFSHWEVTKNIRRLTLLSEEMGLVKFDNKEEEKTEEKGGDRRKLLEEKMNKQKTKYIATKVFDMDSLAEPKNWRTASSAIIAVLEDATATSTTPRSKQMFGNAHKQFRVMTELAEKRQEEKTKLELQLNHVTGKLNKEKKEVKSLRKKNHALESQIDRFQDDITDLKKEVEVRDDVIKERGEQIYELEVLNEEQGEALKNEREAAEAAKKQPPPPVAQPVIPPPTQHQPQQQQQQQQQQPPQQKQEPQQVTSQPTTTNTTTSKEKIPSSGKQQTTTQPAKQKTIKKPSKEGGLKAKKENKEEEKRKKQEKEDTRRTSVIMSLKEAKAELEQIRKAGEARENLVKELKMKLETETAKFEQEKSKLGEEIQLHKLQTESIKRQLENEQEAWERTKNEMLQEKEKLINEVKAKEEIINFQEQRIQEVAREMTLSLMRAGLQANTSTRRGTDATDKLLESKQLLAKLHLQYEYEMEKLRTYVKHESERHHAETRRLESEYKGNLNNIYRDTSIILRAVNRFKDCLAALFDRENLADAAHNIRNIPNLLTDESVTDPHVKLLRMAGGVTELMVQMEFKMSQALMNKRMEMKDNFLEKNFLSKDLEAREDLLKKARELGNLQAEKLKQAREELSSQEIELLKLKHGETDKYVDMTGRNRELTRQNQILNKELTFLQKELQEETAAKENQRQEMDKANSEMKTRIEKQESVIVSLQSENERILNAQKLHLKKYDMVRNVKLLNDALVSKKISEEKHMVVMTIIQKTNEVTGARLACLVRRYLLHRSWKKICEAMKERHKSNKRPPKVETYLKNIEQRIDEEKKKLVQRKTEILQEKTDMYLHFKHMCNELKKEHGVHLIRPNVQQVYSSSSVTQLSDQESIIHKKRQDHLKKMLSRPSARDLGSLDGVQGFKFVPEETDATSWQFPPIETTQSSIVTPKILDMDMKKARESCQRVLTSKSCGNFDNGLKTPWCHRRKLIRESLFSLPPIASLYPEN